MTITKAVIALQKADLLIVAGTSLKVYPAASLINYFFGNNIVLINKTNLPLDRKVRLVINDKIGDVFKEVHELGETKQ